MDHADLERIELEKEISQFLAQSFLELDEGERQLMKRFGVTLTQFWALVHLKDEEGRSLTELAELLICDKSNVTSIVDKFEREGLAERKPGKAGDRRFIRVVLTSKGYQLRDKLMAAQEYLLRIRLQTMKTEDLLLLHAPLKELAGTLQSQFQHKEMTAMIDSSVEYMHASQGTPVL